MSSDPASYPLLSIEGGPAGWGLKVLLDGKEIPNLRGVELSGLHVDGLVTAKLDVVCRIDAKVRVAPPAVELEG